MCLTRISGINAKRISPSNLNHLRHPCAAETDAVIVQLTKKVGQSGRSCSRQVLKTTSGGMSSTSLKMDSCAGSERKAA